MTTNIITTQRLILRSACEADLERLYNIALSDPDVMLQAFKGTALSKLEAENFFAQAFSQLGNDKKIGVVTLRDCDTIIGFAGLVECSILGQQDYEIGFVLGKDYWGKGYASEIGLGQISYGFKQLGCDRLLALVAPKNLASKNALVKLGMSLHSTVETEDRGIREIYIIERIPVTT